MFRPIIRRLRSHRYQEAIDQLYAMQMDHEKLACLADYVATTSRLQLVSFRVPWDSLISAMCQPAEEISVDAVASTSFWLDFRLARRIFAADGCLQAPG